MSFSITETNCSNTPVWKFNTLMIPFDVVKAYPVLKIKCETKLQWICWTILNFFKVCNKRIINFLEVLFDRIIKR